MPKISISYYHADNRYLEGEDLTPLVGKQYCDVV